MDIKWLLASSITAMREDESRYPPGTDAPLPTEAVAGNETPVSLKHSLSKEHLSVIYFENYSSRDIW